MEEQAVETEPAPEEAEKMSEFEAAVAEARAAVKEGTFDAEAFLDKATSLYKAVEEEKASAELVAEAKDSQLQGIKDQFMRLQADFENFRKRQEVEKGQLSEKNTAKVIESFIPLVDTFELARQQIKASAARPSAMCALGVWK